jgi:hypothetical protein
LWSVKNSPARRGRRFPTTAAGPQGPTGQVFNSGTDFHLANGNPASFIFANLNGTISAWNGGPQARASMSL